MQKALNGMGHYLVFNADLWRETAQRAFLGEPGEPGGITLFHVEHKRRHMPFAEHITAERLANKYETDDGMRWEWTQKPGTKWDWGDALTGCYAAAAARGLSASGEPLIRKKKKANVVISKRRKWPWIRIHQDSNSTAEYQT